MSKLIALRIPDDVLAFVDGVKGKRSAVIVEALKAYFYRGAGQPPQPTQEETDADIRRAGANEAGTTQRTRHRAPVPVLQSATSETQRLHPVQSVREELAGRGGHHERPESEPHKTHRVFKAGDRQYCSDCKAYF